MKQKTPMQELIDRIEEWENQFSDANKEDGFFNGAFSRSSRIKTIANQLLEKEKQMIVEIWENACDDGYRWEMKQNKFESAQQYYNKTYGHE